MEENVSGGCLEIKSTIWACAVQGERSMKQERACWAVIKGLRHSTPTADITSELILIGYQINVVCPAFKLLEFKLNLTIVRVHFPSKHDIKDKGYDNFFLNLEAKFILGVYTRRKLKADEKQQS
uniref:Uncharacterized protein n=1 Tax=Glossina austeni TaxID=7395 RepID=A0A1A9URX5_GLOAU